MTTTHPPLVRPSDPDTSHNAAKPNEARSALQAHIVEQLREAPATDWELWASTGLGIEHKPSVVNRRREVGAVDTGERGLSPSGRPCVVWALPGGEA